MREKEEEKMKRYLFLLFILIIISNSAIYAAKAYDGLFGPFNVYMFLRTGYGSVDMENIERLAETQMDNLSDNLNYMQITNGYYYYIGSFSRHSIKDEKSFPISIDFRCFYKYIGIGFVYRDTGDHTIIEASTSQYYSDAFAVRYIFTGIEQIGKIYYRILLYENNNRNLFFNIGAGYGLYKSEIEFEYKERYLSFGSEKSKYSSEMNFYKGFLGFQYDLWPLSFSLDIQYGIGKFNEFTDKKGDKFMDFDDNIISIPLNPINVYFGMGLFI